MYSVPPDMMTIMMKCGSQDSTVITRMGPPVQSKLPVLCRLLQSVLQAVQAAVICDCMTAVIRLAET